MKYIYHITKPEVWEKARTNGSYEGDTLATEGFIHCSTAEQVAKTGNRFYHNQRGLILLAIDTNNVTSEIKYENAGNGEQFPHIYGPLNSDAVIRVFAFEPDADGNFETPEGVY